MRRSAEEVAALIASSAEPERIFAGLVARGDETADVLAELAKLRPDIAALVAMSKQVDASIEADLHPFGGFMSSWSPDGDPLASRPAVVPYLLRLSTGHETSVPYMPRGKVCMVAGMGGVNKSRVSLYLCVCVATGRRVLGEIVCPTAGRVAYIPGEDEQRDIHARLHAIAAQLALTPDERRMLAANLWIGRGDEDDALDTGLSLLDVSRDGRTFSHSVYASALHQQLTGDATDWALVVFDPLVAFMPVDAEADNGVAYRTIRAFRRFTRLPGAPSVLLVHHASKSGRDEGGVNSVRGSGAFTDNARWVAVMTARKNVKRIETVKSNTTATHTLYVEQDQRGDLLPSSADAWDAFEPEKPKKRKSNSEEWG